MSEDSPVPRQSSEKTDDRFRLLVESVKDYGIFTLDPQGFITSWNEGAARIKGYAAAEIIGSHFSKFYLPEDIASKKPQNELKEAIAEGRVEDEGWRVRKDGTLFWADVVITALFDRETGELRGFGKVTRDLTERRNAEQRLRESEEQFRLLVEGVEDYAIYMLSPEGYVMTWNSGAQKAKGYTAQEIIGQHVERFYTPEDRAQRRPAQLLALARQIGHVRDLGLRVRKDGTQFQADVVITAVHASDGTLRGFSKVTRDITDLVRAREAEAARIVAEKASQAKDEFLAILSHELRTPLTPVIAGTNYLLENAAALSSEERERELQAIRRNALLEAQLIDDLLDLTRISRGKLTLRFEVVDLHVALSDTRDIVRDDCLAKNIELILHLAAVKHWTWADPTRLRQAFWNLIRNAVKFTPPHGRVCVRSANDSRGQVVVEVTDSGVGIQPDQIGRIFDAFEQGEQSVTRRFGGLGLGLAITRRIVELHHGRIVAESAGAGQGASFRVTLAPIDPVDPEPARTAETGGASVGLQILLVDDHADTLHILTRLLSKRGHRVQAAQDVSSAIALLQTATFDVLVSDIGLPDGSGLDVMTQARAIQKNIHGIALSGFGFEEDRMRSAQAGFDFHLTKPVEIGMLDAVLVGLQRRQPDIST